MKWGFIITLIFLKSLSAQTTVPGTLVLWNDSPYILTATVQASDGTFLGQLTIQPGEQRTYTTKIYARPYLRPGTPAISLTPYRVIWQCPSEGVYSMCTEVSPGGLVRANECRGNRICDPHKDEKHKKNSKILPKKEEEFLRPHPTDLQASPLD